MGANNGKGNHHNTTSESSEFDEEHEFLDLTDQPDIDKHFLDNALEKIEDSTFDSFNFCSVVPGHGLQFMMYKICYMYNFYHLYDFSV